MVLSTYLEVRSYYLRHLLGIHLRMSVLVKSENHNSS
jgi:hypothetical protein